MNVKVLLPAVVLLIGAGCDVTPAATTAQQTGPGIASAMADESAVRAPVPTADSILPMPAMIARFQAGLPVVDSLDPDAPRSSDELVARLVDGVEENSASALEALTLSRAEFAHLFFPTSIHARPPYAQPPAVTWLLLEQNSLKGRARLLRRFGGTRLRVETLQCPDAPLVQGANRVHESCTLRIRDQDGMLVDVRLFGSIIERDGRFKLVSLSNRL